MPAQCNWTNNNLACISTWGFLRALKQLKPAFGDSGDIKMNQLAWWNPASSPEARRTEALALATQLDNMFTLGVGARYETGFNRTKATSGMADTLVNAAKTVCELSVAVDEAYRFTGEKM
jgi:hypothetical protein